MPTEPDVTFTDYGLAIECAFFVYLLCRNRNEHHPLQTWFIFFFGSLGLAGLTGGTVHGFFPDAESTGYAVLWPLTLLLIGITALAAWAAGAYILLSRNVARWVSIAATAEFAAYCVAVLFTVQAFWVAIANYLPAAVFLFIALFITYKRSREQDLLVGLAGLALTSVAAGIQHKRVMLHPVYFDHNALYHLLQAVALLMIFRSAQWFVTAETQVRR